MSELFLIAHKVRGEPAFDIATKIECPICHNPKHLDSEDDYCYECDSTGYWWIIPTSGHRAYPYWNALLEDIDDQYDLRLEYDHRGLEGPSPMPSDWPDHYAHHSAPSRKLDLSALMPKAPIYRRT